MGVRWWNFPRVSRQFSSATTGREALRYETGLGATDGGLMSCVEFIKTKRHVPYLCR